ncbi:MAG: hypothetical protein ACLRVU_01190 [Beduini sp.]|uniref:hypothetical protein n=1 Tax=Beduini sp. TaxID=1922300 RepID=UPI0039A0FF50
MNTMNVKELGFQLTAYECNGFVNYNEGVLDIIVNGYLYSLCDNEVISLYGNYLNECDSNNAIYKFCEEFFDEHFTNPYEAARATQFGNVNWADEFIRFDGYNNLQSTNIYALLDEARDNNDFKAYVLENYLDDYTDEDYKKEALKEALKLLEAGY